MNRHISTSTGLVILVLILFAAGVAIWAAVPREDSTAVTAEVAEDNPKEEQQKETENPVDTQANIYRSEKYGFQVVIPNGWTVKGASFLSPRAQKETEDIEFQSQPVGGQGINFSDGPHETWTGRKVMGHTLINGHSWQIIEYDMDYFPRSYELSAGGRSYMFYDFSNNELYSEEQFSSEIQQLLSSFVILP